MPTGHVEKIAESNGTMSPQPGGSFRSERRPETRSDLFGTRTRELARTLLESPGSDQDQAVKKALRVIGPGLRADRVDFHLFDPEARDALRLAGSWLASSPDAAEADSLPALDLEALAKRLSETPDGSEPLSPGLLERLLAGEVVRSGVSRPLDGRLTEALPKAVVAPIWSAARTILLVPCVGPGASGSKALLGLFVVQAGLAAAAWSEGSIEQARLVGTLVAGALERHRLHREVARLRERRERDEGLEILGRVAGSVAHDFNNVLTAILGYAELLELDLEERGAEAPELGEIRDAALRASELVEQVLCLGRTAGSDPRPLDLADFLARLEGMIQRIVGEEIVVGLDLAPGLDPVEVDPIRLERAVLNLASNARAAIEQKGRGSGRFTLSTRMVDVGADGSGTPGKAVRVGETTGSGPASKKLAAGRYVRLTARDDGCGIRPEVRDRIFEAFFTTRSEQGGTGLGLASVLDFVESMGGAVRVESPPRKGTAFHLYLPVRIPAAVPTGPPDPLSD
ncbi:MAG TPA: hybrid sensor histidine kinase/response regulator [Deltaproteobacteria bacterium]|nr:hybrid sensor histidine kinase/response regulator [Deltaproteobacteria bacterium]